VTIHRKRGYGWTLCRDLWTPEKVLYISIEAIQQLPWEREIAGTGTIALLKSEFPNCKRLTDKPVLGWGSLREIHKTRNIGILNSIDLRGAIRTAHERGTDINSAIKGIAKYKIFKIF
jgi:hypothetical protein